MSKERTGVADGIHGGGGCGHNQLKLDDRAWNDMGDDDKGRAVLAAGRVANQGSGITQKHERGSADKGELDGKGMAGKHSPEREAKPLKMGNKAKRGDGDYGHGRSY